MKKRSSETLASSQKPRSFRRSKWKSENVDPNTHFLSPSIAKSPASAARIKSPFLPPRPPPSNANHLKRKLSAEKEADYRVLPVYDSGVKVILRIRPTNKEEEGEKIVKKISANALSIDDRVFTFDSVADEESSQQEMFQLVGIPLVENCLAGFNSSVFAYGQTGSGKTYTIWGPANALAEENSSSNQQGLTSRVFEQLFARINEEQVKHAEKKLDYECRCSFLEIYNEQITDLLDPNQRNLQIREDVKSGVYVENLLEEYVCTMKDIKQLLIKGLANRRTGATSINIESSRSHSVFTCVVESRCKSMTDGLSSVRISRINLVDLAGSERQKLTGASGECLKEAGNINRSLSQLGNLINILAEVSQSGKQRHIPYRDSRLTFLLQESLGGNAKLAMICAISPAKSCKSETFSTLRFAHRAKDIKNKAIVNEIMEDDVNLLREQIRQLKDELLRTKSNENSMGCNGGYSTGWNARRSLSLLRLSLNRPMTLPHVEDDSDEEMEIDEEDNERFSIQVGLQSAVYEESKPPTTISNIANSETRFSNPNPNNLSGSSCVSFQGIEEVDVNMEVCQLDKIASDQIDIPGGNTDEKHTVHTNMNALDGISAGEPMEEKLFIYTDFELLNGKSSNEPVGEKSSRCLDFQSVGEDYSDIAIAGSNSIGADSMVHINSNSKLVGVNSFFPSSHTIEACQFSPVHQLPTLSISPRVINNSRKSLRTLYMSSASQKHLPDDIMFNSEDPKFSFALSPGSSSYNAPSSPRSKNDPVPTENLAASLHRGLQSIDRHLHDSALRRSSFRSVKPVELEPFFSVGKVDVGIQALMQDSEIPEDSSAFLCSSCKARNLQFEVSDMKELQSVPVDASQLAEKSRKQVPKAVEKVLVGAIRRETAPEEFCSKQTDEIAQLNCLVKQYKHERECNAIIEQTREDKISRLECLLDGVLSTEEFLEEEFVSVTNEYKLLKEKYESHPEVLRTKIELKRVEEELDGYRNFFDMGEKDVLMEEIQYLRSQLQCSINSSAISTRKPSSLLMLAPPNTIPESSKVGPEKKFEEESHWTGMESKWISLSEELRVELETSRALAEKRKQELYSERKCTEGLKEELQRAIQGNAQILDQYAELQEEHIALLDRNQKIRDGIADVKRAARKAGVKGAESRFINSLAAEISSLKVEREKESRYLREENKALQVQLRDTAEAVQAAGELLVRLKEAEETVMVAQKQATAAEEEAKKARQEAEKLKEKHKSEVITLNQFLADSCLPKEALKPAYSPTDTEKCNGGESLSDQR